MLRRSGGCDSPVDTRSVRRIVWFPAGDHAVVALFAGDKARMGDVFYDSVGTRADAAIDAWIVQTREEQK